MRYCKKKAEINCEFAVLDAAPKMKASSRKKLLGLFIGETARAQNFSLNGYEKETLLGFIGGALPVRRSWLRHRNGRGNADPRPSE